MRNNSLLFGLLTITVLLFTSCQDTEEEMGNKMLIEKAISARSSDNIREKIAFYYKGKFYETMSTVFEDSIVSMDNPEIEELLLELNAKPNLVTFSYPDGTCEYFDNSEEFHADKKRVFAISMEKEQLTKPVLSPKGVIDTPNLGENNQYIANLFLHDDRNYEDTKVEFDLEKGQGKVEIPHLKPYGMNDKTTSFCAFTMQNTSNLFELFEDDNYRSHCFSFLVTMSTHIGINSGEKAAFIPHGNYCAPNLKNIHVVGTKRSSWNDRITSIRITQQ